MIERYGLYLVLTDPVAGYEECARAAVGEGVRFLQLRMKNRPKDEVKRTAVLLREITAGTSTRFIVNDDVALAKEVDADGVHLGQDDLPLRLARSLWPVTGKIFGLSTHSKLQAERASEQRPDYIGVGPVFPTPTKEQPDPVLGVERAGRIIRGSPLASVAIGGIHAGNLAAVCAAGAVNFSVVRAVTQSREPGREIQRLMSLWHDGGAEKQALPSPSPGA